MLLNNLRRLVDVLIAVTLLLILLNFSVGWIAFHHGFNFLVYCLETLTGLVLIWIALRLPWSRFRLHWRLRQWISFALIAALLSGAIHIALAEGLGRLGENIVTSRVIQSMSDEEYLTRHSMIYRNYPDMQFVREARRRIPEDAAVAYFGDLVPHHLNYYLYPRAVYLAPEFQRILLQIHQNSEIDRVDPLLGEPPIDPLPGLHDPDVRAEIRRMVHEKDIQWIVIYDSLEPRNNRIIDLKALSDE